MPIAVILKRYKQKTTLTIPCSVTIESGAGTDGNQLTQSIAEHHKASQAALSRCSGRFFHETANLFRSLTMYFIGHMGICVKCEPGGVMAKHIGQRLNVHPALQHERSRRMPDIMKTILFKARFL